MKKEEPTRDELTQSMLKNLDQPTTKTDFTDLVMAQIEVSKAPITLPWAVQKGGYFFLAFLLFSIFLVLNVNGPTGTESAPFNIDSLLSTFGNHMNSINIVALLITSVAILIGLEKLLTKRSLAFS